MKLGKFDHQYFKSLEGYEKIISPDENVIYHTIIFNNQKAGIVGYIPTKQKDAGFVQILIAPEFRGQGLLEQAEDLLAKKYKLKKLYATISKENIASIRAHLKVGFKEISEEEQKSLKEKGLLQEDQVRLEKNY